jgi:RNA polymerase sigma-70 factor (ECF subfamily)
VNALTESDTDLVRRYRAGDERAASALYDRYAHRLLSLARSRCGRVCAGRFDPDDVVQAVFGKLFCRLRAGPGDVPAGSELWGLLSVQTLCTIRNLVKHHRAARRAVDRTLSADDADRSDVVPDRRVGDGLFGLALREQLALMPLADRRVIELRLAGHEVGEIVERTGRKRRTVERVLQAFRTRLSATA